APCLVFGWRAEATSEWEKHVRELLERLASDAGRTIELAICRHAAGPPVCWCRPPLPGLWLEFARRHRIDDRQSVLMGDSTASRTMARTLGLAHLVVDRPKR
ncbi:MAG: hypothetical protein ABI175_09675, partial [Polyangiales bacterium]